MGTGVLACLDGVVKCLSFCLILLRVLAASTSMALKLAAPIETRMVPAAIALPLIEYMSASDYKCEETAQNVG